MVPGKSRAIVQDSIETRGEYNHISRMRSDLIDEHPRRPEFAH
jgi:hypothetical protein